MQLTVKKALIGFAVTAALSATPALAADQPGEMHGRISETLFLQNDDTSNQTYTFTRTRLYLKNTEVRDKTDFYFDGQYRTSGGKDYYSNTPNLRMDMAKLEFREVMGNKTLKLGRQYVDNIPGARVDGFLIGQPLGETFSGGAFAGFAPDPFSDSFTTAYTTFGAYLYMTERYAGGTLGLVSTQNKGATEQSYFYGSGHVTPDDALNFYGSLRLDANDAKGSPTGLTNLLLSMDYRYGWTARLNASFNQYRAAWVSNGLSYGLNYGENRTIRLSGDYTLGSRASKIIGNLDYHTRGSDGKTGYTAGVGYRNTGFGIYHADASFRALNYFTAVGWQANAGGGVSLSDDLTADLGVSYLSTKQDYMTGDNTQMVLNASANWVFNKDLFITGALEYSNQQIPTLDPKYPDAYKTTSLFLNVDYRY